MEPGQRRTRIRAPIDAVSIPPPESTTDSRRRSGELRALICIWLALAVAMFLLAKDNLSAPGLYYDEAVFAGMAKDFLTGQIHGQHMPGNIVTSIFGRPFPVFIQLYLGALKSWMLMPGFGLFGFSVVALRVTNLLWGVVALLFFMLGVWRWLGLRVALLGGSLLALDPTYFFLCLWDWGAAVPSFVCRCLCFYLATVWWRGRQARYALLTGFFAGLGFFNKIDFAVLVAGVTIAGLVCFIRQLWAARRTVISATAYCAAGFLLAAAPMLWNIQAFLGRGFSGLNRGALGEYHEKFYTMLALYDGSYLYRMISAGTVFDGLFSERLNFLPILGIAVVAAGIALMASSLLKRSKTPNTRAGLFLVLAAVMVTLGVFLLPGAVRIHHAVLVYPLPQLIIAFAAHVFLEALSLTRWHRTTRVMLWIAFAGLFLSQLWTIQKTRALVRETGGRGHWSESFDAFCRENKDRTDLTITSLDWGFNEQLMFLTNGPKLEEPFWEFGETVPSLSSDPHNLYLVHSPEYNFLVYGLHYLEAAQKLGTAVEVRPYFDRQNRIVFYTIQFPPH